VTVDIAATFPDETPGFTPPPTPQRDRGYASDGPNQWSWTNLASEPTPELRWPASLDVYEHMNAQDAQVSSVMRAVISPILGTTWRLDGSGCRPEVVAHVAADLGLPVVGQDNDVPAVRSRGRFSWSEHLAIALEDALQNGHAVFEQKYRPDANGLWHLAKLGYRPPKTIVRFNVARDGGLVSVVQRAAGSFGSGITSTSSQTEIELKVNRLVVYVNGRKGGNWIGRSLLRPAYKFWLLKDRVLRTQAQSIDRNGMGVPVYTSPEHEEDLSKGQAIATAVRAGDNSGTSLPYGAKLELMGVTGSLPNADPVLRYYDEQIARAVLAHFLNLGTQTGSWALGSTFADFFTQSLRAVAENIRDTATQHIVEDLVDINWGPDEPAPRIVFDEIGAGQESTVQALATLVHFGVLHPDEDLEQFVRTALGVPPYKPDPNDPEPPPPALAAHPKPTAPSPVPEEDA
jgi:hypothetical protein